MQIGCNSPPCPGGCWHFKKKKKGCSQVEVLWFGFFNMDCPAWLTTATDRAGEELSSNWRSPNTELNLLRGLSPPFLEESAREKLRIALPPKMAAVLLCAILHTASSLVSEYVVGDCLCCLCCLSTGHFTPGGVKSLNGPPEFKGEQIRSRSE